MAPTYYCLWYRLDAADGYLIWYSDDVDGIVVRAGGAARVFAVRMLWPYEW